MERHSPEPEGIGQEVVAGHGQKLETNGGEAERCGREVVDHGPEEDIDEGPAGITVAAVGVLRRPVPRPAPLHQIPR